MASSNLMDDYEFLTSVVSAQELLQRWQGILPSELAELVESGKLPAYYTIKKLLDETVGDGEEHPQLTFVCVTLLKIPASNGEYDFDKVVFRFSEAVLLENKHHEFTWKVVDHNNNFSGEEDNDFTTDAEWISCATLAKRWSWSPFDVVNLLNKNKIRFRANYGNWSANVNNLHEADIHMIDLIRWESENHKKISTTEDHDSELWDKLLPEMAERADRLYDADDEIKVLTAIVAELKSQNATLNAEIERLRALPSGPPPHLEEAKANNTAARWQGHLRTCITLALHVMAERRAFTADELRKACSLLNRPALAEEALKIFREAMPTEFIYTGGRPKGKTSE